jgi:prepilin-type N-terminal cleavage/methylation domain-containing protein
MLRNEKGFTLLEIIASLTILATAILTLVQMFSGSINQAAQAERYLNGVYLAQQKFSQLELDNFKSEVNEGVFESQDNYRWQLEILPYESPLNNEEARIKIQKVSLRVYWEDGNQEKEVQLVSLKTLGKTHAASALELEPSSQTASTAQNVPDAPKIKNLKPSAAP